MPSFHNDRRFTIENNVLKGEEVSYPDDYDSLGEMILASIEKNLDSVGQIDGITGEEYTYRKIRERSVRCALWMQSQGLRPRDVVAVCSENQLDLPLPCYAALYLGAAYNPWDSTMRAEDFHHQIKITKPKMVFTSEGTAAVVAEAAKKAKLDVKIIVFGRLPGFLEFESVIAEPKSYEVEKFVCTPIEDSGATALITFSSGTTGLPKGIALSNKSLIAQFHQVEVFGMIGKVCLNFAPVSWINGIFNMLWSVLLNVPRIITPLFEENLACALIEKYKATWVFLSPTMINRLLKFDAVERFDLSSVTKVLYAGSPLTSASYKALVKLLPKAELISGYGTTEFGGYISLQSARSQTGSCGQMMANVQLKVVDPDTRRVLGPNQKGEILVKSSAMMSFYVDNPEETAKTIDEEGWLHSGDLGYYNENGDVFVIDRLKDILRSEDFIISPSEIESVIVSHAGVKEVAVVGQPRPDGNDLPIAFVVRKTDFSDTSKQVTETDIVNLVAAKLEDRRKQLHAGVRFVDHLPKTMSDKIRRAALREMARSTVMI